MESSLNRGPYPTPAEISKPVFLYCMHYYWKNLKVIELIKTNNKEVWGKSTVT